MESLGEYIKAKRLEKGLYQKQVAELVGVYIRLYQRWEGNENLPSITNIFKLIEVLELDPLVINSFLSSQPQTKKD